MHILDHKDELVRYKDWAPTQFDCPGLGLEDLQNWYVAPVVQTRDSGHLERSNFEVALHSLEMIDENVEVYRFGHWGPGWVEIIICPPTEAIELELCEIMCALADYPMLDDSHFSALESDAALENWRNFACTDFIRNLDLHETTKDFLYDIYADVIWREFEIYYERISDSDFDFGSHRKLGRDSLALIVRRLRKIV